MTSLISSPGAGVCLPVSGGRADRATWRRQEPEVPSARVAFATNKPNRPGTARQIRNPRHEIQMPQTAQARHVDKMRNKPNLPRFWAENEGGVKNKANQRGLGPRLGIGDCRLGIRGCVMRVSRVDKMADKANLPLLATLMVTSVRGRRLAIRRQGSEIRDSRYEIPVHHVDGAPNKANSPGRARQIRKPKFETRNKRRMPRTQTNGREARRTCGQDVKQTQSWPRRPRLGNSRYEIPDTRYASTM
jgi:hypothetical protein